MSRTASSNAGQHVHFFPVKRTSEKPARHRQKAARSFRIIAYRPRLGNPCAGFPGTIFLKAGFSLRFRAR
jgi:hypothetical protein